MKINQQSNQPTPPSHQTTHQTANTTCRHLFLSHQQTRHKRGENSFINVSLQVGTTTKAVKAKVKDAISFLTNCTHV